MRKKFESEAELANVVREFLTLQGWDVYDEIQTGWGTCDLVGRRGNVIHCVECKLSAGLSVLEQAHRNQSVAQYSSVAVPRGGSFFRHVAQTLGIGVIRPNGSTCFEDIVPRFNRRVNTKRVIANLVPEAKAHFAGTNRGGASTQFKRLAANVEAFVKAHPGSTLKEVIEGVEGMYWSKQSAPYTLKSFIGGRTMPNLEYRKEGNRIRVYPKVALALEQLTEIAK